MTYELRRTGKRIEFKRVPIGGPFYDLSTTNLTVVNEFGLVNEFMDDFDPFDKPRYVIRCHTVREFDAAWTAWILDENDEEIDSVLEADDKPTLLSMIEAQGGTVVRDTTEEKPFNRVYALMKFDRADLIAWLDEYFGIHTPEGSYYHELMRAKTASEITTEDFWPLDSNDTSKLADYLIAKLKDADT